MPRQYGMEVAERLAQALGPGGRHRRQRLARGIDAAAHRGALDAGGRTFGVLGSGPGEVLSAVASGVSSRGRQLGSVDLRDAAACRSGQRRLPATQPHHRGPITRRRRRRGRVSLRSLITARHAMEQGRDVFAVPGRIDSGCRTAATSCSATARSWSRASTTSSKNSGPLPESAPRAGDGPAVHKPAELLLNTNEKLVLR